jgi:hypothetical protein
MAAVVTELNTPLIHLSNREKDWDEDGTEIDNAVRDELSD